MSYEEKGVWGYLTVAVGAFTTYAIVILVRARGGDLTDAPYVSTLLWTVGLSMVVSMFVRGAVEGAHAGERNRSDERDRDINRRGEHIGGVVVAAAMIVPFVLAIVEADHFWIANAIYTGFVLQAATSSVVKLVAYRRGL